jgi:hypothetical protein
MGRRQGPAAGAGNGQFGHAERLELSEAGSDGRLEGPGRVVGRHREYQAAGLHARRPMQVQATLGLELEVTVPHSVAQQDGQRPVHCRRHGRPDDHHE